MDTNSNFAAAFNAAHASIKHGIGVIFGADKSGSRGSQEVVQAIVGLATNSIPLPPLTDKPDADWLPFTTSILIGMTAGRDAADSSKLAKRGLQKMLEAEGLDRQRGDMLIAAAATVADIGNADCVYSDGFYSVHAKLFFPGQHNPRLLAVTKRKNGNDKYTYAASNLIPLDMAAQHIVAFGDETDANDAITEVLNRPGLKTLLERTAGDYVEKAKERAAAKAKRDTETAEAKRKEAENMAAAKEGKPLPHPVQEKPVGIQPVTGGNVNPPAVDTTTPAITTQTVATPQSKPQVNDTSGGAAEVEAGMTFEKAMRIVTASLAAPRIVTVTDRELFNLLVAKVIATNNALAKTDAQKLAMPKQKLSA